MRLFWALKRQRAKQVPFRPKKVDISDFGYVEVRIPEEEPGARTSEGCMRIASRRGHHYVEA
jgi:hypothetical protein